MIEFKGTGFTYDGDRFVLDGVDARIVPGEFVCILGGNGSGKSTLAKHINALLVPDEGSVTVLDHDTRDERSTYFIRSHAGMVFQNPDDQLVASLIENDVAFGPENLGVPTDDLRQRVADALADVGLQGFDKRETAALSGGQKQRVAIAGVLAMEPSILILDEATAMLDPRGRKGLMRVCHELHDRGMTVVMITHFMEEASSYWKRAASPATARRRTCSCRPSCWNISTSTCRSPPSCRSSWGGAACPWACTSRRPR